MNLINLVCYMEFRMASKLKNHEKIHIYETPHTCSMPNCGLIFKTEAECKKHEESHNQRFKCEICGKQLASEKVNFQVPRPLRPTLKCRTRRIYSKYYSNKCYNIK